MAHFAKVQNNLVVAVLKFDGDDQENPQVILDGLFGPVESWIKTSYNTKGGIHYDQETEQPSADQTKALRKNYAAIGYTYNEELDAFIPPCPTYSNFNNISLLTILDSHLLRTLQSKCGNCNDLILLR
jgi:hypothetical protein